MMARIGAPMMLPAEVERHAVKLNRWCVRMKPEDDSSESLS